MKRAFLSLILAIIGICFANAELTTGYYKVYCCSYGRYMTEDFSYNLLTTSSSCGDTDYEKIWKIDVHVNVDANSVKDSTVTLQNVYTGHYVQAQNSYYTQFTTGTASASFKLTHNTDTTYMFKSGSYMHCDGSYKIVIWWEPTNVNSYWMLKKVDLTDEQVAEIQKEYQAVEEIKNNASTYNQTLQTYFTDLSCSELKSDYSSMTDEELRTAMSELPITLQDVAVKVKNGWDSETDATMSKKFRIREYQTYTRAAYWRSKVNATQFTDMNNPTGIFGNNKTLFYVFVGGAIPDGCTLKIIGITGGGQASYSSGTSLKQGLNVIQTSADFSHLWVMYTYDNDNVNANTSTSSAQALSSLDKLKIHIEGGDVYGFADVAGMSETEANAEYKAALDNANAMATAKSADITDMRFVVKGERGVFYFPLDTYNKIWKQTAYNTKYTTDYSIYKSMHWFDNVLAWEWGIMGFTKRVYDGNTDAHEHVTGGKDIYPTYCNNLALTVQAEGGNPYSTDGYTCMPGVGGVESSYNAERADFDNWCVGHESGHNNQGVINLPSSTESSNNLFSNVVCYLHGYRMSRGEPVSTTNTDYQKGTQFSLRNIATTHRMYWQLYLYYHEAQHKTDFYPVLFESLRNDRMDLDSNTDDCFLKFYQKVCDAAQEDLTEFFRGWGFFVPFENQTFGDYTSHTLTLTQEQIDAAIAAVKAKGYPENKAIMFIEDRIKESYRWDAWATGTSDVRPVQDYAVGSCGDVGSVTDYVDVDTNATTMQKANYTSCSICGHTITMNGKGGVGFLIYSDKDSLVAFSNCKSFTIPDSIAKAKFTVKVMNADNTYIVVDSIEQITLKWPEEGKLYRILSARSGWNKGKAMTANTTTNGDSSKAVSPGWETTDTSDPEQLWYITPVAAGSHTYNIKNYSTGTYIKTATSLGSTAADILFEDVDTKLSTENSMQFIMTISGSTKPLHCRYQADGYVSGPLTEWGASLNNASCWYVEEYKIGDVDNDGKVQATDATYLISHLNGGKLEQSGILDINKDGKVDVEDVKAVVNVMLNK